MQYSLYVFKMGGVGHYEYFSSWETREARKKEIDQSQSSVWSEDPVFFG